MTGKALQHRLLRRAALAILWVAAFAPSAQAHGGMAGPDELGPPVFLSVALGIICYWIMILWPVRREPEHPKPQTTRRRTAR
jgi:hypothetical protein